MPIGETNKKARLGELGEAGPLGELQFTDTGGKGKTTKEALNVAP